MVDVHCQQGQEARAKKYMNNLQLNEKAFEMLKEVFGFSNYRYGQQEIVENIISGKKSLAIMPTDSGKSLCYQLPSIILQKKTIIISPLIALIDDQVASLRECGVNVEKLHSNQSTDEQSKSWYNFKIGKAKLLYVSPERLMTDEMINNLKSSFPFN